MVDQKPVTLVPNGNGAQLFLGPDLLDDSACPFDQGDDVVAANHDEGILLKPTREIDYELVPQPDTTEITPHDGI